MLKRTVRNYLAWTAFAVAGGLMVMQAAKSGVQSPGAAQDDDRVMAEAQRGIDGVIEVENDLAIREGPRELARAGRDAGAASGPG